MQTPGYYRPETMTEALDILARGPVTLAAGCTDLFAATGARALSGPVLDITGVVALRGVTRDATGVHIGAATTWSDLVAADLPPAFDMLKQAAVEVGSLQIQNAATLVGNVCNASPAADGAPCLLALDAEVEIASANGSRRAALAAFVTGPRRTTLAPGEMVTALHLPDSATYGISCFRKLGARRYLVISIAMVAVRLVVAEGLIAEAAVAVGACSAVATRLPGLEAALIGKPADASLSACASDDLIRPALSPIDDIRADAAYRGGAAAELVRRALADLVAER